MGLGLCMRAGAGTRGGGHSPFTPDVAEDSRRPAGPLHRASRGKTLEELQTEHERRVWGQARRLERRIGPKSTRGTPQRVTCLTRVDPSTGQPVEYPTASAGGKSVGRTADNIRQSILRGGLCGGDRWAYTKDVTAEILKKAVAAIMTAATRSPNRAA